MEQHDDFKERPYFVAVRAKLGEALREKHDLMEPLAPGLFELLAQLDSSIHVRQSTEAKLYAEIDECVAAMVCAAKRKPSEPGETAVAMTEGRRAKLSEPDGPEPVRSH